MEYRQYNITRSNDIFMASFGNPFGFKQATEREMLVRGGNNKPGQGPHHDPGDTYVLVATVVSIIICCTIGVIIGGKIAGFGGIFLGVVVGLFVGGIGGSYLGEYLKNRKRKKSYTKKEDKETENKQGPFIN